MKRLQGTLQSTVHACFLVLHKQITFFQFWQCALVSGLLFMILFAIIYYIFAQWYT